MPSLHAADALIVGICLSTIVKSRWAKAFWLAWPIWVWFCVMATANHFVLDVFAGVVVAGLAWLALRAPRGYRRLRAAT
jgi:membrane-associated phospholipid phosphatase